MRYIGYIGAIKRISLLNIDLPYIKLLVDVSDERMGKKSNQQEHDGGE